MSETKEYKEAVLQMYAALLAYRALDYQRVNCEDCMESGKSAEACGDCFPYADDARCQLEPAIAAYEKAVRGHACMDCSGTGEERSGVCHCGISLNLHSVYENHTAVEMTRTCEACGGTGKREVPNAS